MKFNLENIIRLIRPHQYIKNLFIFMPLFFVGQIQNTELLLNAIAAFIAFSCAAGAIYTFNDYHDIEDDRKHPRKKSRPLASGAVSKRQAIIIMALLASSSLLLMVLLSYSAAAVLLTYVAMNVAYTIRLKHIAIADVTTIAIGFVLRLFIGSTATGISLSIWIVSMTFLLALFMAFAKRRDDVLIYMNTGKRARKVIDGYNLQFLDTAMSIMASVVIVAYLIYVTSPEVIERIHNQYIYLTTFFVILGILRYLKIALVDQNSGSPTEIVIKDRFIQIVLAGWIITFSWILY